MALSHTGFFLLRSPLFPIKQYHRVLDNSLQALAGDHPVFLYALSVASGELLKELERYLANPAAFTPKKVEKLQRALYKYWVRACTRSTPYGLFAGCTTGTVGETSTWQLAPLAHARQHVRLDMDYYTRICHYIQRLPEVREALTWYTNNSVYKSGEKFRYAEYIIVNNRRKYLLTAVADSVFIQKIIREAAGGLTIPEMVQLITNEDDSITAEEGRAFINELIDAQLLIAEIEPRITEADNLQALINRLASIEAVSSVKDSLQQLQHLFQQQDFEQARLAAMHDTCNTAFPLDTPKDLLQVDLFKTAAACTISEKLLSGILQQVGRLMALCHGYAKGGNPELAGFVSRFKERYESQEVPLNLVLDAETGIGYGSSLDSIIHAPFVEDITGGNGAESAATVSWSPVQQLCLEKYEDHLRRGGPVTITDEELKKLGDPEKLPFARSSYLFGSLYANSAADADNGVYTFALQSMGGPSAANLLGRFCSGDPHLADYVHRTLAAEEAAYPDVIFAEVVHFPEARAANVLIRPPLRQYEIPYIGMAGVAPACQLPVSDLMVSVQDNEVVLRSKRLDKRIIPRLSSAHNYSFNSLPVYKFLCDLQHQSLVSHLFWDWGILAGRPSLPRVTYKNIVLCRATWTITPKDLEDQDLQHFEKYRQQQGIPDRVLLSDFDNELLLDLTQPIAVGILLDHLKRSNNATLKEFLADEQQGMLRDERNEVYAHELLVPLIYTSENINALPLAAKQPAASITRSFAPGSEWLYLKIYCGYRVAEELLAGYFAEQVPLWQEDGLFEQFFFLRYGDPQPHIRLRFLNNAHPTNNDVLLHNIQTALQPYIRSGQVQKLQCDTYVREIERYTAAAMLQSEELFFADSIAVLGIISLLEGPAGEDYRWKLALRGMDMMLDDFGLTLPERKQLLAALRAAFVTEFGGGELLHKPLNDKYRKHQQQIMSYLNAADDDRNDISEAVVFFQQRTHTARSLTLQIRRDCGSAEEYERIVAGHLHMFMNRLFVGKQRKYELVLYHFLEKYYLSQLALVTITR